MTSWSSMQAMTLTDPPRTPSSLKDPSYGNANRFQEVAMGWHKLPMPRIAAVHGVFFGGGLQVASVTEIRVVAPDARMSVMEMKWGLLPDMGDAAVAGC